MTDTGTGNRFISQYISLTAQNAALFGGNLTTGGDGAVRLSLPARPNPHRMTIQDPLREPPHLYKCGGSATADTEEERFFNLLARERHVGVEVARPATRHARSQRVPKTASKAEAARREGVCDAARRDGLRRSAESRPPHRRVLYPKRRTRGKVVGSSSCSDTVGSAGDFSGTRRFTSRSPVGISTEPTGAFCEAKWLQ